MKTFISFLVFCFITFGVYAQTPVIDSLKIVIKTPENDTGVAEAYLAWGEQIIWTRTDTAIVLFNQALDLALTQGQEPHRTSIEKKAFKRIAANVYNDMGVLLTRNGQFKEAISNHLECKKLREELGNKARLASTIMNIGGVYNQMGITDTALHYYMQSLEMREGTDDPDGLSQLYHNIGGLYGKLGDVEKALEHYFKALKIREENEQSLHVAFTFNDIGFVYNGQGDKDKANHYYKVAYDKFEALNDSLGMALALSNIGAVYSDKGEISKALENHILALNIRISLQNHQGLGSSYNNIGHIYMGQKEYEKALENFRKGLDAQNRINNYLGQVYIYINISTTHYLKQDYLKAEPVGLKALEISQSINLADGIQKSAEILAMIYEAKKDWKNAFIHHQLFISTRDSLVNEKNQRNAINQEMQYNYNKKVLSDSIKSVKQQEVNNLKLGKKDAELNEQRAVNYGLVIGGILALLVAVLAAIAYIQKRRSNRLLILQKNKIEKSEKEKELMLKEIHHRVKNNLQIITGLLELQSLEMDDERFTSAIVEGQNRVKSMALIHQKLYQVDELAVIDIGVYVQSLANELEAVYNSGLHIDYAIDCGDIKLDIDTAIPIGLILNELISNTWKYAIKDHPAPKISLSLESVGESTYTLSYQDNGPGLPADLNFDSTKTLGMRLVKRLAQQLFGKAVYSGNDKGCIFEITFKDNSFREKVD
jgi:two-component sensor histidine kinase/Tfp pilus assembly protein PilF